MSVNYFNLSDLDVLNPKIIDISSPLLLNNYKNLYSILNLNMTDISIHNTLFSSYITNKHIIKYNITFNNNNSILFNNSTILPTLYSNYIYQFYQPAGFYIK